MKFIHALLVLGLAIAGIVLWSVWQYPDTVSQLQCVTRLSGRLSLLMFSFIFLLYPLRKNVLKNILSSRYLLLFALQHGFHLVVLLTYVYLSGVVLVPYRVAGGFFAYAIIFLMPWFEARVAKGKLTMPAFDRVMTFYQFYVWFIFFMTYVARVNRTFPNAGGTYEEHVTLMSWVCVAVVIKVITYKKSQG